MSCENCQLEKRMDVAEKNIKELQDSQNKSDVNYGKMEVTLQYIKTMLEDVKLKVDKITEAPGARWNIIVNTGIAVTVSTIITAIMFLILKK
jgi:hypothetical protein